MPLYEHVFLARQDLSQQQVDALSDQYKGVIEPAAARSPRPEYWGVKSLTYRIRKNRKAHFTLMNLDAPPAAVAEMERQMRISEDVMRFMTVRVEAHRGRPVGHDAEARRATVTATSVAAIVAIAAARGFGDRAAVAAIVGRGASASEPAEVAAAAGEELSIMATHSEPGAAVRSSAAARPARSPAPTRRRSTTRTCGSCSATFPSAARSCRRASRPSRQKKQRELAQAIKRARFLGLLPYVIR